MRDYVKAIEALQEAAEHDDARAHTKEIQDQMLKCQQAQFAQREGESDDDVMQRAMRDPEVAVRVSPVHPVVCPFSFVDEFSIQQIMGDPVMQSILQQAQTNPAALQDHMKNPIVRNKINKLISAGIIRTR
jgi:stress-induced-phosphoprotein 1